MTTMVIKISFADNIKKNYNLRIIKNDYVTEALSLSCRRQAVGSD